MWGMSCVGETLISKVPQCALFPDVGDTSAAPSKTAQQSPTLDARRAARCSEMDDADICMCANCCHLNFVFMLLPFSPQNVSPAFWMVHYTHMSSIFGDRRRPAALFRLAL